MSADTRRPPRQITRVVMTAVAICGCLLLYAAGYYYLHQVLVAPGGLIRLCADIANRSVYYPVNYGYQRWIWNARIPWSGRIACTFLAEHAGYGSVGLPMDTMPSDARKAVPCMKFIAWDPVERRAPQVVYEKAKRDYDAWYQKALRGEVDPGIPITSVPDFFHATFIVTYTQHLDLDWYRSYGAPEVEFISIEGRGLHAQ